MREESTIVSAEKEKPERDGNNGRKGQRKRRRKNQRGKQREQKSWKQILDDPFKDTNKRKDLSQISQFLHPSLMGVFEKKRGKMWDNPWLAWTSGAPCTGGKWKGSRDIHASLPLGLSPGLPIPASPPTYCTLLLAKVLSATSNVGSPRSF